MHRVPLRQRVVVGFASLALIPSTLCAATLREEALAYRAKGYEAQRRGDTASALSLYQKAAALDPSNPTPHNDLGILLEGLGRFEEAERSYLQALSLNKSYLKAHTNLAILYERVGQPDKAIDHWMKRFQLGEPKDPWTQRAEARLLALGTLTGEPLHEIKTARHIVSRELQAHAKSLEDFHAVTDTYGDWP